MSLNGRKKRVKRSGEHEIDYNVHKFVKTECEVGNTIRLSKVKKRVAESTLCRVLKEVKNVETVVRMAFSTAHKTQAESLH